LYASSNVIRMITSRRARLAGHAARMGRKRNVYREVAKNVGSPEGKRSL
jgi:hypothetical protein